MSVLILVATVFIVGWKIWCIEDRKVGENKMIRDMVKRDIKSQRKRGDIIKEASTRGY